MRGLIDIDPSHQIAASRARQEGREERAHRDDPHRMPEMQLQSLRAKEDMPAHRRNRDCQHTQQPSQRQKPGMRQRLAQLVEIDQPEIKQRGQQHEAGGISREFHHQRSIFERLICGRTASQRDHGDLTPTIEAQRHFADAEAVAGIADHRARAPLSSRAEMTAPQAREERAAIGQANLPAMRVTAEIKPKSGRRGVIGDFRRMD